MRPGDPQSVENLFNDLASKYDLLNDLLSLGLHRFWKRQLLVTLSPSPGENWLDLCCGTGDLALSLARRISPEGTVLGIDSAVEPLALARKRSLKEPWLPVTWVKADVLDTGLTAEHFDGAVMAYGLRNLVDPKAGLRELHRLLKPGARAGILDFNHLPDHSMRASFQKFYLRNIVVPIAAKFDLREHYVYLEESIKCFPDGHEQECLAKEVGFSDVNYDLLAAGLMGVLFIRA